MSIYTKSGKLIYLALAGGAWAVLETDHMKLSFPCDKGGRADDAVRRGVTEMRMKAKDILDRADRVEAALAKIMGDEP